MHLLPFIQRNDSLSHCSICPVSNQSRLAFPQASLSKSPSAFHFIHMDIWGPFHVPTSNGEKYFLTIVDDFTRATWVYLIQSKLDVLRLIKILFVMVNNQFSTRIRTIRTDNATDFLYLGVRHYSYCPYTLQQNGIMK